VVPDPPKKRSEPSDVAVYEAAAREVQRSLGRRALVLGVPGRTGRMRFWGEPTSGRRPSAAPTDAFPGVARALAEDRVVGLGREEAARFGADVAVAVPFAVGDGTTGVCVLLGLSDHDQSPEAFSVLASGDWS
jgi:hypothetical protein